MSTAESPKKGNKRKVLFVALIALVVALVLAAGILLFLRSRKDDSKNDNEAKVLTYDEAAKNYLNETTDPRTQASIKLGLANSEMLNKNYDGVISYSDEVLNSATAPADMKQIARRNLMYAYNFKNDNTSAKKYAEEYKQNLTDEDPELKVKEALFIDKQIEELTANKQLSSVGGSEEGE